VKRSMEAYASTSGWSRGGAVRMC